MLATVPAVVPLDNVVRLVDVNRFVEAIAGVANVPVVVTVAFPIVSIAAPVDGKHHQHLLSLETCGIESTVFGIIYDSLREVFHLLMALSNR